MSSELVHNLRLVRCPKCKLLLPENPEYDVYECGECGTKLQAKKRKSAAMNSESSTQETDAASRKALNSVSGSEDCISKEQIRDDGRKAKATSSSSSGECHSVGYVGRGQNKNGECVGDELLQFNLRDEELESELDIYKLSLRRRCRVSNNGCSNQTTRCEIEEIYSGNMSSGISEKECICSSDENRNKSTLVGVMSEMEGTRTDSEIAEEELSSGGDGQYSNNNKSSIVGANLEVEINGSELEKTEDFGSANLSQERAEEELVSVSVKEDENKNKLSHSPADVKPEMEIPISDLEEVEELGNENLLVEEAEVKLISGSHGEDANEEEKSTSPSASPEVEIAKSDLEGAEESNNGNLLLKRSEEELMTALDREPANNEGTSITKSSSAENFVSEKESILRIAPNVVEQGGSGNPASSNKLQKHTQKSIHDSFEHSRSMDTLDAAEYVDPSSELSGTLGGFSKSPTAKTRSFHHAYDGSLSSYDGMDERFSIQHLDSFENTGVVADGVLEEMTRKGKGLAKRSVHGDLRTQHQSYFPNVKHQRWTRTRRDEIPPRMPFHRSGSRSRYESSSLTNQIHDEPYYSSSFLSHEPSEKSYQEKMKLMRMIHKLQDQLNRTRDVSRQFTGVSHKGKHISAYDGRDLHEGRPSRALDYPRCNGRCRHNFSRTPYSDQATSKLVGHSCSHCYLKERCLSADFSPRSHFQHEELCRSCIGHDCFSSHRCYSSSPQWLAPSKLRVYSYETQSDDQKRRDHEVKRYLREKNNSGKQNYRPVAGGAPFVTCHKCLNLLRLPADFLLSERGPHQLKCGECSEVLKFSLRNGSLVSYPSNALGSPSSVLNDQSKVIS